MPDRLIIGNYKLQTSNYIAYDLLHGRDSAGDMYTENDREIFVRDVESKISTMAGDPAEMREIFLKIYARPYQSKLELNVN